MFPCLSSHACARAGSHRALEGNPGSGMGADSAFEEMIRLRSVVHRPAAAAPQSPPRRGLLGRRRYLG